MHALIIIETYTLCLLHTSGLYKVVIYQRFYPNIRVDQHSTIFVCLFRFLLIKPALQLY